MSGLDNMPLKLRLGGEEVCLRPAAEADTYQIFVSWWNHPSGVKFSNQRLLGHTRKARIDYLDSFVGTNNLHLANEDGSSHRLHGTITAYRPPPHGTADIGIMVGLSGVRQRVWIQGMVPFDALSDESMSCA